MAAVATRRKTCPKYSHFGELLRDLGDISPDRVAFDPPPGRATLRDLHRINALKQGIFELVDGTLVEKAMAWSGSIVTARLIRLVGAHVDDNDLGVMTAPDGMYRFKPKLVREPDISYMSWERLGRRDIPSRNVSDIPPDLAVEVLSDANTPAEMARKREEYFNAGVRLVWIIDPDEFPVDIYTAPTTVTHLTESDALDGGDVLPGFRIPLKTLFAKVAKPSKKKKNGRGRV